MDLFFNILDTELIVLIILTVTTQIIFWTLFIEWCRFLLTPKVDYSLRLGNRSLLNLGFWLLLDGVCFLWYFADETGYDNTQGILIMGGVTLGFLLLLFFSFLVHRLLFFILDYIQFRTSFRNHIVLLLLLSSICIGSIVFVFSQGENVRTKVLEYQKRQYK